MAVPVAVTNPPPDTELVTSVGKVEKNSMTEFWMEIDENATPHEALVAFSRIASDGRVGDFVIMLFDHKNNRIERRW